MVQNNREISDNEIIKGLEYEVNEKTICVHEIYKEACGLWCEHLHKWCANLSSNKNEKNDCPEFIPTIPTKRAKAVLDLINRYQTEIERLNGCVKSEDEIRAIMKSQMTPMVNEIVNEQFDIAVKLARAEAIKDFAERLTDKAELVRVNAFRSKWMISDEDIDNLVKQMTESEE